MDQNSQTPKPEEEKLLEAPPEEKLLEPPESEKLLPEHASSPKNGSIMKLLLIILGALVILAIASTVYLSLTQESTPPLPEPAVPTEVETPSVEDIILPLQSELETPSGDSEDQVFCTMDAKICPDGSSVGRQGPNCEFAACPGE